MIDGYALTAIILRSIAIVCFSIVLYRQIRILRKHSTLQWLKHLLIFLTATMLFNGLLSLSVNLYRQADGNLFPNARHVSVIVNAVSGLCSSVILLIIYKKDE